MVKSMTKDKYTEIGVLLKEFYWEYLETNQEEGNEFITIIQNAFSLLDETNNPYANGNFNVSFSHNNSYNGAKKFFNAIKESEDFAKIVSLVKKTSEYTSNFRIISLLILAYMFDKLNVANSNITFGIPLALVITCLIIEGKVSIRKSREINDKITQIKDFLDKHNELEHSTQLSEIMSKITQMELFINGNNITGEYEQSENGEDIGK